MPENRIFFKSFSNQIPMKTGHPRIPRMRVIEKNKHSDLKRATARTIWLHQLWPTAIASEEVVDLIGIIHFSLL